MCATFLRLVVNDGRGFLAGGIPEKTIDMVRSNADILDVVGNFVQMRHAGKNWVGLCPFHAEKTPSFSINEQKQFFTVFRADAAEMFLSLSWNLKT